MNKYNILLITKDTTIIEYINETFDDCSIDIYSKEIKLANKYDIIIIDDYKEYNSIREAADAYETSSSSISFALKHPNNKCVGLYWAYCEGDE